MKSDVSRVTTIKQLNFDGDTAIIDNTMATQCMVLKSIDSVGAVEAESEEEPDFDETPMEIELPDSNLAMAPHDEVAEEGGRLEISLELQQTEYDEDPDE